MQKTLELLRAGHPQEQRRKAMNIDSRDQAATCRGAASVPKLTRALRQFRRATPCYPWSSACRHFTEDRSLVQPSGNLSRYLEACGVRCDLPPCERRCTCTPSEPINISGQPIDGNRLINGILTHTCEDKKQRDTRWQDISSLCTHICCWSGQNSETCTNYRPTPTKRKDRGGPKSKVRCSQSRLGSQEL